MLTLFHHPFSPSARFVRLILAEYGAKTELQVERPWERRRDFLLLNPAGTVPVLRENDGPAICGVFAIMEYIDETRGYAVGNRRLMPDHPDARAETRRLVDWAVAKLDQEVVGPFVRERVYKQEMPSSAGGGAPDSAVLRAARTNIHHHMRYFGYLAATRNWLSGDRLSFADFAVAAELSCADYLGEVPWAEEDNVKAWYARIKSRPSFRPLLAEKILGMPPSPTYEDLDF
ncbi:glutathione S-transferase family protein [Stappia sp. F7233]|uniref:Glutathione S-transferase family protein n=1 Tax=Stappia albiluteola TaxID=2758565 RepID=A0A839AD39_9HYPH|nr:glutathione S-transferase family protein [Stappia albiluteola]MBA5777035.1 glutathione S-transferase family protein [Stappia albiluteola]